MLGILGAVISLIVGLILFITFMAIYFKLDSIDSTLKKIHGESLEKPEKNLRFSDAKPTPWERKFKKDKIETK